MAQQLFGEQRVAVRLVVHPQGKGARRLIERVLGRHLAHERTLDRGNSVKIGEQLRQRMTATDLRVAVGAEHEDRLIGE